MWVRAVQWRAGPPLTLHRTVQAAARLTGTFWDGEGLAVSIDTLVEGTPVTHGTTGAVSAGGVQAGDWGTLSVCTHSLSIQTGAAGARTLRMPERPLLVLHPLQHTRFAYRAAELGISDGVGALHPGTSLLMAPHISILAPALKARSTTGWVEHLAVSIHPPLIVTHVTGGAALSGGRGWVAARH